MGNCIVYDIEYDVSKEELEEHIEWLIENEIWRLATLLDSPISDLKCLDSFDIYEMVEDAFEEGNLSIQEVFDLPKKLFIPAIYVSDAEKMKDYIASVTGIAVKGFTF